MNESKRLFFVDNIRALVILTLIPFHAAITYTGNGDVYVYDHAVLSHYLDWAIPPGITSVPLNLFVDIMDNFFMRLLFLAAGISAFFSLKNRTPGVFLRERVNKLLLPLGSGILLVIPIMSYIRNLNLHRFKGSFFRFYPRFFNGPRGSFPGANFEWGHLWFLIYLFVYALITLPLFIKLKQDTAAAKLRNLTSGLYLLLPLLPMMGFEGLFRPGWPGTLNLYNDWANFFTYLLFYLSGYLLAAAPGLLEKLEKIKYFSLAAGIIFFLAKLMTWKLFRISYGYNTGTIIAVELKTLAGYFLVAGITGFAYRYFNINSKPLQYLNTSSFGIYVFHFLPVTVIGYFLLNSTLHYYVKFFITVLFSYLATFAVYEGIRRIPFIRFLFGIKKPVKRKRLDMAPA